MLQLKSLINMAIIRRFIGECIKKIKIYYYNNRRSNIIQRIQTKGRLTIVFMPIYLSMWKYDKLVEKLLHNPNIDVYIVPLLYPSSSMEYNMQIQSEMKLFFTSKGFPYIDGYDFIMHKWFDASILKPDIVVFTQPYNVASPLFKLENFWKDSLFVYTPYGIVLEYIEGFYNSLLQNIAYKLFYPTIFNVNDAKKLAYNKGDNIVITGYPIEDEFRQRVSNYNNLWKQDDSNIKRIIWAPHHSIKQIDTLDYSTFLDVADVMIDLCRKYNGKIQFAFKPHPVLKKKLYSIADWGKERTDTYYRQWQDMPNSIIIENDYVDLFLTSDAMIHDCSSFMAEYLYVNKPVMYLSKPNHLSCANEFGRLCYDLHYHGYSKDDIIDFIENIVIKNSDSLLSQRSEFITKHLMQSNTTVADNMYQEIVSIIQ